MRRLRQLGTEEEAADVASGEDAGADVITTAERARREGRVRVRFSDDHVEADVRDRPEQGD